MRQIKCDKCGKIKKILDSRTSLDNKDKWISGNIHSNSPWEVISFDLCEKCSPKLKDFVKKYLPK
ncbi:MAG: hypothetical protein V1892_01790 [bacterium]